MSKKHGGESGQPPKVTFRDSEPLQDYYNDGAGNLYSVARLLDDANDIPVFDCPLAALDLTGKIWDGCDTFELAAHVRSCMNADLDFPILLDWRGAVADGRHRIIKAIAQGRRTIKAKRMWWQPTPCRKVDRDGAE